MQPVLSLWRVGTPSKLLSVALPKWGICDAVVHSEGKECGLSAEASLQDTEGTSAPGPGFQALAIRHAALSPTDVPAAFEDASQGNPAVISQSQLLGHLQLEAAGREAAHIESSSVASMQGNSSATAFNSGEDASSQTRRSLKLLAVSRARQSLQASAAASASPASSLVLSTQHPLTQGQVQQAVSMNSSGNESPQVRPGQTAKTAAMGRRLVDPAASDAGNDGEPSPVCTADTVQSSTAEVDGLHSKDSLGEAVETAAMSQPRLGRSESQQAVVTVSARSEVAEMAPSSDTQEHAELSQNVKAAAEDDCITVAALGRTLGSAAETSVAAGLLPSASRDSIALHDDYKPVENAAADESTCISTSSTVSSSGSEHTQIEQDAPASQPALSFNSGSSTAGVAAASLDAALQSSISTVQQTAQATVAAGSYAEEVRDSIGSKAAQVDAAVNSYQHSSRSSSAKAAGADRPGRSFSSPKRSSASRGSVSSHSQPERSLSPDLPAVLDASLRSDNATVKDGRASADDGKGMAGSLLEASPSAPVDPGESLTGASGLGRSAKSVAAMGASLNRSEGRTANAVSSSLSQMGKKGGAGVIRHSVILTGMDPLDQWLYSQPGVLTSLDYDKVKTDLQVCHESCCCQALQLFCYC